MNITAAQATELLKKAVEWKRQGARSKWTTPESLALWDAVDALEKDIAQKTFTRPANCPCGEELPWHLAPFARSTRPEHPCKCGRSYVWTEDLSLQLKE